MPVQTQDPFTGRIQERIVTTEVEIDEELLQEIAAQTGGEFFRADAPESLRGAALVILSAGILVAPWERRGDLHYEAPVVPHICAQHLAERAVVAWGLRRGADPHLPQHLGVVGDRHEVERARALVAPAGTAFGIEGWEQDPALESVAVGVVGPSRELVAHGVGGERSVDVQIAEIRIALWVRVRTHRVAPCGGRCQEEQPERQPAKPANRVGGLPHWIKGLRRSAAHR